MENYETMAVTLDQEETVSTGVYSYFLMLKHFEHIARIQSVTLGITY
jgi:hypothetical protein